MTQAELNRAVAMATGETVAEVKHRGFSLADVPLVEDGPTDEELSRYLDWDALEAS